MNRPTTETNALGTTTTTYNADSEITSIQDADGRVRDFSYDNDQNLTAENWMNGNTVVATITYGYDLANELTSASDPNSAYAFTYDGDADVTSVDNNGTPNVPHVVLTNTFDLMGDRLTQSATIAGTADFINSYSYDGDQNLTVVQQQQQTGGDTVANKEVDYAYNALGQFTAIGYYDQFGGPRTDIATGAFSYDGDNRLTGLAYTADGGQTAIDSYGWGYNAASLVTSFTTNEGTASYGYDPTNQLTSASYTGTHQPANESYSFTKNGNRNMTGYSTGSDNLITSDGTYTYQHDADGSQTVRTRISNSYSSDYRTTYTWDYRNRLTDVENYDNNAVLTQHVHYVFDVFDHLIATEVDTTGDGTYDVIDHYVLDVTPESPSAGVPGVATAQPVLIFNGSEALIGRNLVAPNAAGNDAVDIEGTVTSLTQADTDQYNLADDLGSLRIIVNNASAILDEIVYNSPGQIAYESAPVTSHFAGFAGGHVDPYTALDAFYHRFYDSETAKWLSQDPADFAAGDNNLTRMVGNDPTNFADPLGLRQNSSANQLPQEPPAEPITVTVAGPITSSGVMLDPLSQRPPPAWPKPIPKPNGVWLPVPNKPLPPPPFSQWWWANNAPPPKPLPPQPSVKPKPIAGFTWVFISKPGPTGGGPQAVAGGPMTSGVDHAQQDADEQSEAGKNVLEATYDSMENKEKVQMETEAAIEGAAESPPPGGAP